MPVYVNGRFLTQPMSGVQRYAFELLTALDALLDQQPIGQVEVLSPGPPLHPPNWRNIKLKVLPGARGHLWEQRELYHATRRGLLISLCNAGPLRHNNHVLVLHDANIWAIPEAYTKSYRALHKALRPLLARRARQLITISQFSARELSKCLNIPQDRFEIVPNGCNHILRQPADPAILERKRLPRGGFLLCVGNQSANKNVGRLIKAHRAAQGQLPPLVIAGAAAPGLAAPQFDPDARVRFLGRVSDGELRALYEAAAGFVFPSLYEGFGIPPLEAMLLGTPVLAARRAAMPEILGDAPNWFDPLNTQDMTQALLTFAALEPTKITAMIERGYKIAAQFTWEKSAQRLLKEIQRLDHAKASVAPGARPSGKGSRRTAA